MRRTLLLIIVAGVLTAGGIFAGLTIQRSPATRPHIVLRPPSTTGAASNIYNVPASYLGTTIYADCSAGDATVLNAWLASIPDGSTINFASTGCYGLDGALLLSARNNLTISGNGATFELLTTEGQAGTAHLNIWNVVGGTNITLSNMNLIGASEASGGGGTDSTCQPSGSFESQYGIALWGVDGASVNFVNVTQSCGDFIDILMFCNGTISAGNGCPGADQIWTTPSENISINGGTDSIAGRQGITVADVVGATIENVTMSHVGQQGVDLEPDNYNSYLQNITVENNSFSNMTSGMFYESGGGNYGSGNILVTNNTQTNPRTCGAAIGLDAGSTTPTPSGFTVTNNNVATFAGPVLTLTDFNNVDIESNTNTYTGGTVCHTDSVEGGGSPATALNIVGLTITGNTFAQSGQSYPKQVLIVGNTGITGTVNVCGNVTALGGGQPTTC